MPVLREEQRNKLRMHTVVGAKFAPEKAADEISVNRRVVAREVYVFQPARHCAEIFPEFCGLRGLAGSVEPLEYN